MQGNLKPKDFKMVSKGFNLIADDDKDLFNLKEFAQILNKFYKEGKLVSLKSRKEKRLLKTVIKKGSPKALRAHSFMIFFGGFLHLKGQRYESSIDYPSLLKDIALPKEESEDIYFVLRQIDKDLVRTHFPQEEKVRRYEKLWGVKMKVKSLYSYTLVKENTDLLGSEDGKKKCMVSKEIQRYLKEIEMLTKMTRNVLFAYSQIDPETGYVQGMNSIASCVVYNVWTSKKEFEKMDSKCKMENKLNGVFGNKSGKGDKDDQDVYNVCDDMDFSLEFSEEECFYIFYGIMRYGNQKRFFDSGMDNLQKIIQDFELYFSHMLPDAHDKMCVQNEVSSFQLKIKKINSEANRKLDPYDGIRGLLLSYNLPAYNPDQALWKGVGYFHAARVQGC